MGSAVLLVAAAATGGRPRLCPHCLAAAAMLSLHLSLWLESLRYASVAASTGIVVFYPALAGLAEAAKGAPGTGRRLAAALLAASGVVLLSTPWAGATLLGALLAFLAAVAAAAYMLVGRRLRTAGVNTAEYAASVYTAAALIQSAMLLAAGTNPLDIPRHSILYLLGLGLGPMALGHTMLNYALGYYPASTVGSVALLEPYGAMLLEWLLSGTPPPIGALPGVALSVAGAWLSLRSR